MDAASIYSGSSPGSMASWARYGLSPRAFSAPPLLPPPPPVMPPPMPPQIGMQPGAPAPSPSVPTFNQAPYAVRFATIFAQAKAANPQVKISTIFHIGGAPFNSWDAVFGPELQWLCSPSKPKMCGHFHLTGECLAGTSCQYTHELTSAPINAALLPALHRFQQAVKHYITNKPNKKAKN